MTAASRSPRGSESAESEGEGEGEREWGGSGSSEVRSAEEAVAKRKAGMPGKGKARVNRVERSAEESGDTDGRSGTGDDDEDELSSAAEEESGSSASGDSE